MENKTSKSKFISRQTVKIIEQAKRVRIFLIIGAVLGIASMFWALKVVDKRENPEKYKEKSAASQNDDGVIRQGDFEFEVRNGALVLIDYNGKESAVNIPDSVEGKTVEVIGKGAFCENLSLISVTMGSGISCIEDEAFLGCSRLINVELSRNIRTIGVMSFANCSMLKTVVLPESFENASHNTFLGCAEDFVLTVYPGTMGQDYAESNGYDYKLYSEELIG